MEKDLQFYYEIDPMNSNSWVISGRHTKSGKPLIANDTHMGTVLPSVWSLGELSWGDNYVIGAQLVGMPGVSIGRNKNIAWSLTAALVDSQDLWEEEVSEDGMQYKVDGEWRDFTIVTEQIKIAGKEPLDFEIKFTHRGALMDYDTLKSNSGIPKVENTSLYSFGWSQSQPGDSSMDILILMANAESLTEIVGSIDTMF